MKVDLFPLKGVYIDDIYIELGSSVESLNKIRCLGNPDIMDNVYYFLNSSISFHLDNSSKIEFIELSYNDNVETYINNINIFKTTAEDIIKILKEMNNNKIDECEDEYGYYFWDISIGINRDITPEDIKLMIKEAKSEGTYSDMKEDLLKDQYRSNYFSVIGIGNENYYR